MIREMTDSDRSRVREIYAQGIEKGTSTFSTECPDWEEWNAHHLPYCRFVYETDGNVVGWIAVSPTSYREPYRGVVELSVYVDDAYHGKGVGTALMNHLADESPKHGIWSLYSVVFSSNEASLALHRKCGFREIGYRERVAQDKFGVWNNTTLFEKRL